MSKDAVPIVKIMSNNIWLAAVCKKVINDQPRNIQVLLN